MNVLGNGKTVQYMEEVERDSALGAWLSILNLQQLVDDQLWT